MSVRNNFSRHSQILHTKGVRGIVTARQLSLKSYTTAGLSLPPNTVSLLRERGERPRGCCATNEPNELPPLHVWMAPAWQETI